MPILPADGVYRSVMLQLARGRKLLLGSPALVPRTNQSPPIPSEIGSSEMEGKTVVAIAMERGGTVVVAEESVAGTGKVFRRKWIPKNVHQLVHSCCWY
jgi:hypothetical protein